MPLMMLATTFCKPRILADAGVDPNGSNLGADILLPNPDRERDFDNVIGQGIDTKILFLDFTASYQLRHNLFIDFNQVVRDLDSADDTQDITTVYTALAIRLNIAKRLLDF